MSGNGALTKTQRKQLERAVGTFMNGLSPTWQKVVKVVAALVVVAVVVVGAWGEWYERQVMVERQQAAIEALLDGSVPEYDGRPYVELGEASLALDEVGAWPVGYEMYSELDALGRCGVCEALVGPETMPEAWDERGDISSVRPSGWQSTTYEFIKGRYLYNRCHLIGWQLSDEDANERNLVTGTRTMNVDGMLLWENVVAGYVLDSAWHVAYRVTPVFVGDELVCRGVVMEGLSVDDGGVGVNFKVWVPNVEPGVWIDYATGASEGV